MAKSTKTAFRQFLILVVQSWWTVNGVTQGATIDQRFSEHGHIAEILDFSPTAYFLRKHTQTSCDRIFAESKAYSIPHSQLKALTPQGGFQGFVLCFCSLTSFTSIPSTPHCQHKLSAVSQISYVFSSFQVLVHTYIAVQNIVFHSYFCFVIFHKEAQPLLFLENLSELS